MFPCYVTNPCPASCHSDFFLLACQPRGIHARGCSNENSPITVITFVLFFLKSDYFLVIGEEVETVVTTEQWCQAGYSWASQSAGALCGAKVNVSTGLACSIAARLVVNHWPLMYIIKTPNKSNNKRQKNLAGHVTVLFQSLKVFTTDSKLKLNFFFIHSLSCGFIVLLDPRDQTQCAGPDPTSGSVTPVCKI